MLRHTRQIFSFKRGKVKTFQLRLIRNEIWDVKGGKGGGKLAWKLFFCYWQFLWIVKWVNYEIKSVSQIYNHCSNFPPRWCCLYNVVDCFKINLHMQAPHISFFWFWCYFWVTVTVVMVYFLLVGIWENRRKRNKMRLSLYRYMHTCTNIHLHKWAYRLYAYVMKFVLGNLLKWNGLTAVVTFHWSRQFR